MQVTTNPTLNNIPRTLSTPKDTNKLPDGGGDGPNKGGGFGDRFMSNLTAPATRSPVSSPSL